MQVVEWIARKRDGLSLSAEEIDAFIQGFARGDVPDYQVSAWLMAVVLRGMQRDETIALTHAIVRSGLRLNLEDVAPLVVDKHSTGGVGDKTTLVVAPLAAAAGLVLGKMSGRGLEFTGGTLDKLESIAGFRSELTTEEFRAQLKAVGVVVCGQSAELAPADGKLYALRDVTATVPCLPLVASSIMSKKIAAGANGIVLDVKVGSGAFMKTEEQALELARLMVDIGRGVGLTVRAVISDMSQPLGRAVGNALELREAIETLHAGGPPDLRQHCLTVTEELLRVAGRVNEGEDPAVRLAALLDSGAAWQAFRRWIAAQGGDLRFVDDLARLPAARLVVDLPSPCSATVAHVDAEQIGLASMQLGGGRSRKGDAIDHAVGVVLRAKVGDRAEEGQPIATLHANDEDRLAEAVDRVRAAYGWSDGPVSPPRLMHQVVS